MKKIVLIITIYLPLALYSQYPEPMITCAPEIYTDAENFSSDSYPMNIVLEKLSPTWMEEDEDEDGYWDFCDICDNSDSIEFSVPNDGGDNSYGWNRSQDYDGGCGQGTYGYGFYIIFNDFNGDYFYLDMRDCDFWDYENGYPTSNSGSFDVYIKSTPTSFFYRAGHYGPEISISRGEIITIREIWDSNPSHDLTSRLNTSCFEDYWTNCLVMIGNSIKNVTNNEHPLIIWGPNPIFTTTHYKIYKTVVNVSDYVHPDEIDPENPPSGYNFLLAATVNVNKYSWIDQNYTIAYGGNNFAYYYVKAYSSRSNTYSEPTNVIADVGERAAIEKIKGNNDKIIGEKRYVLSEAYPNPFNPTTTITYSLPEKQEVKISVYDPFGREVAELVNGLKTEGKHSVDFDGSNLASGVYYYTITAGNYTKTKKLMLLK